MVSRVLLLHSSQLGLDRMSAPRQSKSPNTCGDMKRARKASQPSLLAARLDFRVKHRMRKDVQRRLNRFESRLVSADTTVGKHIVVENGHAMVRRMASVMNLIQSRSESLLPGPKQT